MSTKPYYLKLRSNIILEGDVDLAERELQAIFKKTERIGQSSRVEELLGLPVVFANNNTRLGGCIGFMAQQNHKTPQDFMVLLNFFQEIWFENCKAFQFNNESFWQKRIQCGSKEFICMLPLMACSELLSAAKISAPKAKDISVLMDSLTNEFMPLSLLHKNITYRASSTPHIHSLHKFKAKFFPRLIRSFLTRYLDVIPRNSEGKTLLLDPFVGSGTSLVEASLLGIDSTGIDIDKLSCAISQAKIEALSAEPFEVEEKVRQLVSYFSLSEQIKSEYKFPVKISKKFDRWNSQEERANYERCIAKWISGIERFKGSSAYPLLSICLSDAISRKFVIRMLGTGVGRFAFEIAKTPLDRIMLSNLQKLLQSIRIAQSIINGYNIRLGKAEVFHGSAVSLPILDNKYGIIITSPPYLPASSGREDYLIGKSISNLALDLMSNDEIIEAEAESVGSMMLEEEMQDGLPIAVYDLYNWLSNNTLRSIKAKPTFAYYVSLKRALGESFRVLMPGGLAIYIIGKESVFYKFSTREVLYRVHCDKIFEEIALSSGFHIIEKIDVELDKKNKNARPRSLDSFYESVFILRKPI
jgi:DNA modification methylase